MATPPRSRRRHFALTLQMFYLFCVTYFCSCAGDDDDDKITCAKPKPSKDSATPIGDASQVLRTYPMTDQQLAKIRAVRENYDFWTEPRLCGPTDILVNGDADKKKLVGYLGQHKIEFNVRIPNVTNIAEGQKNTSENKRGFKGGSFNWKEYHALATINKFVTEIAEKNKDVASLITIGQTYEKKNLRVIRIGVPSKGKNKPKIWVDAGIHAREWIAIPTALYIVNELLNNKKQNMDILKTVDIYVLPVLNPDGYHYSRTSDRMWRKNRRLNPGKVNSKGNPCDGVDLNRNFDAEFGGVGTSRNPCVEIFRGTKAFSEPESLAVKNFIEKDKTNWILYLSFHSYGQVILTPWGYTDKKFPPDYKAHKELGKKAAKAVKAVHGKVYRVGSAGKLMGAGAGGSDDWSKLTHFKYSFTMELRDEDDGKFGFLLPEYQIQPTAEEAWAAFKVFVNAVMPDKKKSKG